MKRIDSLSRWTIRLVASVCAFLALSSAAPAASVRLDVEAATPMVLFRGPQTTYLRVALTGLTAPRGKRAPVNVAIVLDQSGSMAGKKLEEAKRAAILAIERLRDEDIVSVVTYQSTVDVLVPATRLYDRTAVRRAIEGIRAGGSTALFAGVSKGAQELRKFVSRNRVNTLLLLSDGLANVGPRSPGELEQLGSSLAREGMTVTTIGLGLQYNEDLMVRLAMASDGNHFFVEDVEDLEAAFATEFGDALSTVAQGVTIRIRCPRGIRPIRVLGRDASISGQEVFASMNQLYQEQTRYLLLEVEVEPGTPGRVRPMADVSVQFRDLVAQSDASLRGNASITYTGSASAVEERRNRDVMVAVVSQVAAEKNKVATALRDEGKIEQAKEKFKENATYLEKNSQELAAPSLGREAESTRQTSESLSDKDWNRERKKQVESQMKVIQQRAPLEAPKKPNE